MSDENTGTPSLALTAGEGKLSMGALFGGFLSGLNAVGTAWIFVIMVLINTDVAGRYLFNAPLTGVPLIVSMSIVAIVFLQLPDALRRGRLTRNEVLIGRLLKDRAHLGHALQSAYHLFGFAVMAVIFYFTVPMAGKAWQSQSYLGTLGDFTFPEWPTKFVILVGSVAAGVQFLNLFTKDLRRLDLAAGWRRYANLIVVFGVIVAAAVAIRGGVIDGLGDIGIGALSVFFVLVFVYAGVHVGITLALLSFASIFVIRGDTVVAGKMLSLAASDSLARFEFGVIPLFVLMGLLVSVSDIGKDTYEVANQLFRKLRGGLGTATVFANAVFAAVTGTSIASASVFTKIAVPEMLHHGYNHRFAVGVVAGSSVLGMLIPPSLLLILFGILSETSIGDLFIAGILPGILLSAAYAVLIAIMAYRFPAKVFAESHVEAGGQSTMPMGGLMLKIAPIIVLIFIVMGGIYGGVFTATEAGGVGALGALLLALLRRKLTWRSLWRVLVETGHVTASISFLLIGAHIYARMIAVTGIPDAMELLIQSSGIGFTGLILIFLVVIILLGTILDAGSIMLITVPLVVPVLVAMEGAGVETNGLIWFGIITIIGVEIGLLTPPLGIACFVIHNNLNDDRITVNDIFRGAFPFAVTMVVVLILVVIFPQIALFLTEFTF